MASTSNTARPVGQHEKILSQYDDDVLDESEQESIIASIRRANDKSNYMYRVALVVIYILVFVLYLTPIPAYALGQHPKSHMSLFLHPTTTIGTHDDLTYLPVFPIYITTMLALSYLMGLAVYELFDVLRWIKPQEFAYPAQPHPFGTAPNWIVPVLRDVRIGPSNKVGDRADKPVENADIVTVLPPRIVYIGFLWICFWPIPLMTFGLGAFEDALWWAFPFFASTIHLVIEWWIYKADL
ncbi:hypothetical protein MVES_002881 [Malassezia vespertilionis]|uniref:Uncharacterized protein n=1 Tax=Malassezia vespertilionis TaxID=2020962 RepID=A0A2N1J996_9BASI|nr:hypothetical protein MVES_002881 [Malassezia vespertilionis]